MAMSLTMPGRRRGSTATPRGRKMARFFSAITLSAAAIAGVTVGAQGAAFADSGTYTTNQYRHAYAWYRDLPADTHQQGLAYFSNATDVAMCTAYWDRGNLYRTKAYAPGASEVFSAKPHVDAIVDCRYFLA
ncbi:hypothetical protein [Nonomuraea sp. NPDC050783]|uniref:hypothetical protein n=1 Tax=Nonomuraea sp. NPDC050783 TaxID=3154634 RepID=UPI003467AA8E